MMLSGTVNCYFSSVLLVCKRSHKLEECVACFACSFLIVWPMHILLSCFSRSNFCFFCMACATQLSMNCQLIISDCYCKLNLHNNDYSCWPCFRMLNTATHCIIVLIQATLHLLIFSKFSSRSYSRRTRRQYMQL